jgi:hypothetical protein
MIWKSIRSRFYFGAGIIKKEGRPMMPYLLPAPTPRLALPEPEKKKFQKENTFVVHMKYGEHQIYFMVSRN